MPSQGPSAPAPPSAPEDLGRASDAPAAHRAARADARQRDSHEDAAGAVVIPIGRLPARLPPPRDRARPPSGAGAPRADPPPAPWGPPARHGDLGARAGAGVLRLVRRNEVPGPPHPSATTPPPTPSRRPRPPPRVTASATPAVLRTVLLVLFAAAAVALIGGQARADDRDAHQRRSAGSRLQPVRFTWDDSALQ